jgi:two-component system OmpR family response regulator
MSTRKLQSVLYVDDDPDICEVVQTALCLIAGLTVHTAGSGERAIELAHELRPDLVLMDVMMPGLDGPSTVQRMRESTPLASTPVIFLTAKVLPAEVARFRQLGAIGVIGKPFDPLTIGDDVCALWKEADTARGGRSAHSAESHVQAQVSALAGRFLQRTRGDVVRLVELIERAQHGDRAVLEAIERVAHSIHGTGATFGFAEISASGGAIERLAQGVAASTAIPNSAVEANALQRLMNCTERLAQEIEAAGQSPPSAAGLLQGQR